MKQDSALARAARLVSDGEYEKALRIYESACEAAPRDERGRCGKALASTGSGDGPKHVIVTMNCVRT